MSRVSVRLLLVAGLLSLLDPRVVARAQAPTRVDASADAIRLNNLGVASMNQQKFEIALKHFQDAVARDASLRAAHTNQAIALLALQRYEPARELLDAAVKETPDAARAWYNLGLLQKSLGDADASVAAFTRASELAPTDAHARYFAGLLASQLQQYDAAIAQFLKALELDPFLVSAEFGLARAYQRAGKTEEAKTHMDRFTRLTQSKVASAMSLAYGDQGPLSLAEAVRPPASATKAIPVTFVADPSALGQSAPPLDSINAGPGACLLDFNGDGGIDVLRLGLAGASLRRNTGKGQFVDAKQLTPDAGVASCAVGDYDNDERPDIAIAGTAGVLLFHNDGDSAFTQVLNGSGIPKDLAGIALGVSFVDIDHDADLDLVVAASTEVPYATTAKGERRVLKGTAPGHAMLFRNNGNSTFVDVTTERGFDIANTSGMTASDLNNDRAIDLVLTGERTSVLINPREGAFTRLDRFTPAPPVETRGVVVADVDKDGWMDLIFSHAGSPGISLWRNLSGTAFEQSTLPLSPIASGFGVAAFDYDNDGWLDVAAVGTSAQGTGVLQILRNVQGRFEDVSATVGAGAATLHEPRALLVGDLDNDFDADLVVTDAAGPALLLRNDGGNTNKAVRLALSGLNDNRSALGTKVEVQAGAVWQKLETVSASGFLGQSSPELLIGIGPAAEAEVVRLLWPTGVVQDEVELAAGTRHAITQIDRRGSSCPILFSWNGSEYEFVSDSIGPAVIGHWVAPGEYAAPDIDEYVKVDGAKVRVKDGRLSFQFVEPMEEINYLDRVRLFVIDHPQGTEVYPNEYFASRPPWPAARTIATRGARLPIGAWDDQGRDVMPALRHADRRFVDSFESDAFKGFAKLHGLELDLGEVPSGSPVRLLMRGFTDYFTATSMFAAHQAHVSAIAPYVEAQCADGSWVRIADDIGFPAGLLRTMAADLTGKLPAGTRRVRIWTNLKVYWDQILVDTTADGAVPVTRTELPLATARLGYLGYPREVPGRPAGDLQYVFSEISRHGPYARHRGFYTRYGDVTPLLRRDEDHFVIFGSGENVAIEFDASTLPPLREGWTRDYEIYLNGYVKDMDFYGAYSQTVAPLPFRQMPGYPYPRGVSYPDANREYQLEWNTREVQGEGAASYRFAFPSSKTAHSRAGGDSPRSAH
jgi:Tfp pilus assembly protein PilF